MLGTLSTAFLAACTSVSTPPELVEVRESFEFWELWSPSPWFSGCILHLPENLEALDRERRLAELEPARLLKVHGWLDQEGRRQGRWQEWVNRRRFLQQGHFLDGRRIGVWTTYAFLDPDETAFLLDRRLYHPDGTYQRYRALP